MPVADEPSVALPAPDVPHGSPFGPIWPAVPGFDCVLPSVLGLVELVVALDELEGALGLAEEPDVSELGFDVLGLIALGFDALGLGLPGVVAVLPALAPPIEPDPVAPELAPAAPPPPLAPPAAPPPAPAANAPVRPVVLSRTTVASKANRCLVCGMFLLL